MDKQQQAGGRPGRRNREEIEQLLDEFDASGLSQAELCRRRRMGHGLLSRYLKQRRERGGEGCRRSRLVEVEISGAGSGAGSGLAIALTAGLRIEVGRGFDAHTLVELLGVLERS